MRVSPAGSKLQVERKKISPPLECRADGPIEIAGRPYRGTVRIIAGSAPLLVNELGLEDYLAGVINAEISSAWPAEAVKAQAILARTYAMFRLPQRRGAPYDLEATVKDQVYLGAAAEDDAARRAVAETRGMVLTYAGEPVAAYFHSACGGRTESPEWVWGGSPQPYQQSVECGYCEDSPNYFWRWPSEGAADAGEVGRKLGLGTAAEAIEVITQSPTGRAAQVRVGGGGQTLTVGGNDFRQALGYSNVRSAAFRVDREDGGWVIRGTGSGHGAGMCQWGAKGMAEAGQSAAAILTHYFPGTELRTMY